MKSIVLPRDTDLSQRFPNFRRLCGWEGGSAKIGEYEGKPCIICDERTLRCFLDEEDEADAKLISQLLQLFVFDYEMERETFIRDTMSRFHFYSLSHKPRA